MTVLPINYTARSLRLRVPRICVSVTAADPAELIESAEAILRESSLLELRLDYLKSPLAAIPLLRRLTEKRPDAILIATCRRTEAGGHFSGTVEAELDILRQAIQAGCPAVDLEIESAEALPVADYEELRSQAAIVLSSHDYNGTSKLDETFTRMRAFTADFYKLVGTANCLHDNVTMIRFLERHCDEFTMVGMCMGELGLLSRILGIRTGAAFTFGSAAQGRETAPGQPTYRELRDFYRVEQIESVTKVYGIAGDPVSHSMSPWVLNSAFRRENVNAVYLPLHAKKLDDLLATLADLPLDGMSVTMPYKQAIVEHLDNSDVLTQRTGACNTVVRGKDGRLFGFNTDVYGIAAAIEPRLPLQGARVLVLGAGGAARAAVFGLRAKGAEVFILNRTPANAQTLAKQSDANTVKRSELPKLSFDLILNATPVGMGDDKTAPLEAHELNTQWVFDTVYNPLETPLLKLAQSRGLGTISGVEMFVHQAARQFEIWTGKPAPLDGMRQVLLRQLGAVTSEGAVVPTVVAPKSKPVSTIAAVAAETSTSAKSAAQDSNAEPQSAAKPAAAKNGEKTEAKPAKAALAAKAAAPAKAAQAKVAAVPVKAASKIVRAEPGPDATSKHVGKAEPAKALAKAAAKTAGAKPATAKVAPPKPAKAAVKAPAKTTAKAAAKPAVKKASAKPLVKAVAKKKASR